MGNVISTETKGGVSISRQEWSYSRTSCFEHCKYEYYLGYVIHDDNLYLSEGNFYAEVGSFAHEILAKIFLGELKPENALDYYLDHFEEYVSYKTFKIAMNNTYEAIADYFATLDLSWLDFYEIVGVEQKLHFEVCGHPFVGIIDLLLRDKRDGKLVVLDHKSMEYPFKVKGGVKKKCEKSFNAYRRQMYLYSKAIHDTYGEFPKGIAWNYFKDGGRLGTIQFLESEYKDAIEWFQSMAEKIPQEQDFEATQDYFYCSQLCNFRNSCEYRKMGGGA